MSKSKMLSNPFSTGSGGAHFEAHVQASFVALMLSGGHAPCLPCWPITEIKLQGKIDGFDTDDLIVVVENPNSKEQRKLLGQVKHSVAITQGSVVFGEVIQAAWNDFNNPNVFTRGKDVIALITGPLSATDAHNVQWLLNQARRTTDVDEFLRNVQQANFSPSKCAAKLSVIQDHLNTANGGNQISKDELYDFLNHFHLLGYDLGSEFGVVLSLLHSHISQFQRQNSQWVWSRVVDVVQTWNQDAGTIAPGNLPEDLLNAFTQKAAVEMPEEFKVEQEKPRTDWAQHPDATYLAVAVLIGAWNENSQRDLDVITQLFGISYDEWLTKARAVLHCVDSPLSLKNGIWKVGNRAELWNLLGSRILDQDLDTFKALAVTLLTEPNPAFSLPAETPYAASIRGKVFEHSHVLREGFAEGLAILGCMPHACSNCSRGKAETVCVLVLRDILSDADWVRWGSLNRLLPTLAEAAPGEFIGAVENALRQTPCPFAELIAQEGSGVSRGNYLAGLLWALEGLAWDEMYLVRVCVAFGELASLAPGDRQANRPSNSLATILLPWYPQTLASVDKRKVAVRTLLNDSPAIAWKLIIQLLPGQHQVSSGSHKPSWRKAIPDDWEKRVTNQEYWQQVYFYAELAVTTAGHDPDRLSVLIDHFGDLPQAAADQLVDVLTSQPISALAETQRLSLWDHVTKFINRQRRFSDKKRPSTNNLINSLEQVAKRLAPTNPFNLYQPLFVDQDFDLYEEDGDWEEQGKKLNVRREKAIREIFQQYGVEGVIRFADSVASSGRVGQALGVLDDDAIEQALLPELLDIPDNSRRALVSGFIWRRHQLKGWGWCDNIDKSGWTPSQIAQFLACLPFSKETWDRASAWLDGHESLYWTRTGANAYQAESHLNLAIEKLIEHGRPHAAINCLDRMHHASQAIDVDQCVRALIAALSSSEPPHSKDDYHIIELIQFLQTDPSVPQDDLFKVEWAYLSLLDSHRGATPQFLERKLASEPEFFCEVIQLVYRSSKDDQLATEPTEEKRAIATNAWRLLDEWKIPPGTQKDGSFNEEQFVEWLESVKAFCIESGHLEVALISIGEVLIHAPCNPDGLWIHRAVAAALNDRAADGMRRGFRTGVYNSRGVHYVDPTGTPERELAALYRSRAEEIENAGFQRFAVTLRGLADGYDREAERIIDEHKREDE